MPSRIPHSEDRKRHWAKTGPTQETHNVGDVGLIEYSPKTTRWECKFEHCRRDAPVEKSLYQHRKKERQEQSLGTARNPITCPYCRNPYSAHDRLPIHIELAHQTGNRNAEISPNLNTDDAPMEKWNKVLRKMNGNIPELRLQPKNFLADTRR